MRLLSIVLLILAISTILPAQEESIVFYNGFDTPGEMYIWDWGLAATPQTVAGIGYTPGTAALDVKYDSSGIDPSWLSIGTFFGYSSNVGVSLQDIFPDSVYFKLKAPDGISDNDSLVIWLYDSNNSTWDNANFLELENFDVLADSNWHQFGLNLWDFQPYLNDMNIDDFVAVSIEAPIANLPTRLFIDDVWAGNPYYPVHVTIFDGKNVSNGITYSSWGFSDGSLQIAEGEGFTDGSNAIVWETSNGDGWQGQSFAFDPQDMRYSWPTDTLNLNIKAPAGINTLSLGFYDKDGNCVWYAVDSEKFGFDGDWKHLSIALKDFQLYWDKFDTSKVTEFRLENGYENQPIAERLLFDNIYTGNTGGGLTSVKDRPSDGMVTEFALQQNYPNPFNPSTTITFTLAKSTTATLSIYNVRGEKVAELVSDNLASGRHSCQWDAGNMPSGAYFYKLETEEFSQTHKMLLIR